MIKVISKIRELYKTDIKIKGLTPFQRQILLGRLTEDNIKNFNNDPNNVINNTVNIDKLRTLATKLPDSDKVIEISKTLVDSKRIVLITDFDADGLSSAVVMEKCLDTINQKNYTTIFNKRKYGTGVTNYCLEQLFNLPDYESIDIIILADHGSSNGPEYDTIRSRIPEVEIILTDHHQVDYKSMGEQERYKFAFINAHRTDVGIEDKVLLRSLSGCSIAYFTMLLLAGDKYKELEQHMYLPAISTISDVMPLDNPINRYIVKNGLNIMYSSWPDLYSKIMRNTKIGPKDLSFGLIPIINTGNRADLEEYAIDYLRNIPDNRLTLEDANRSRKYETKKVVTKLLEDSSIVGEYSVCGIVDCEYNIAGNVASSIGETYNKPTILFNRGYLDTFTGSIRGIVPNIDVVKALRDIEAEDNSILVRYGGHKGAAGCSIYKDKFEVFKSLFDKHIGEQTKNVDTNKYLYVDCLLGEEEIDVGLYKSSEIIGPYGNKWDDIVYVSRLHLSSVIPMGTISKLILKGHRKVTFDGIMLTSKSELEEYIGKPVYIFYNLDVNNRINNGVLELKIHHIAHTTDEDCLRFVNEIIGRRIYGEY